MLRYATCTVRIPSPAPLIDNTITFSTLPFSFIYAESYYYGTTMQAINYEQLLKEAAVHFSRSGGKGGQNVNKVETRVELVFNIPHSTVLDEQTKAILLSILKKQIDHEGNIHVTAHTERLQHSNRKKAEEKLIRLIQNALKPRKKRIKTEPSKTAKIARLYTKKRHGLKKQERRRFDYD